LDDTERSTFTKIAGDRPPPSKQVRELWAVVARRSGKSRVTAALAVFLALFQKHNLAKGETGYVLTLAATADQAKTVYSYVLGFLESSEALRREMRSVTATEVRLANNVTIGVHANSFRTIRGKSILAAVFDETAFWREESSAMPDVEVYRAVMPSLIAANGMLIGISTPYRLPVFSRGLVSPPEHRRLGRELRLLERHVSRAGRDRVDHGRGGHDDYANAVFGALNLAMAGSRYHYDSSLDWVNGSDPDADAEKTAAREWQEMRMAAHIARYAGGGYRRF
jgi:hypothetical protein